MRLGRTLLATLSIVACGIGSAVAGEYRGQVTEINREAGTLQAGPQTVHVSKNRLRGMVANSRYVVVWETRNGRAVATSIREDTHH